MNTADAPISYFSSRHVFVVRWRESKGEYFDDLIKRVTSHHQRYGPLVYFSVTDNSSQRPDDSFLSKAREYLPKLLEMCTEVHLVVEGTGMKAAVQRSVLSGVFLVVGKSAQIKISPNLPIALDGALGSTSAREVLNEIVHQGYPDPSAGSRAAAH